MKFCVLQSQLTHPSPLQTGNRMTRPSTRYCPGCCLEVLRDDFSRRQWRLKQTGICKPCSVAKADAKNRRELPMVILTLCMKHNHRSSNRIQPQPTHGGEYLQCFVLPTQLTHPSSLQTGDRITHQSTRYCPSCCLEILRYDFSQRQWKLQQTGICKSCIAAKVDANNLRELPMVILTLCMTHNHKTATTELSGQRTG